MATKRAVTTKKTKRPTKKRVVRARTSVRTRKSIKKVVRRPSTGVATIRHVQQTLWPLGMAASVVVAAIGLWQLGKPTPVPSSLSPATPIARVEIPVSVPAPASVPASAQRMPAQVETPKEKNILDQEFDKVSHLSVSQKVSAWSYFIWKSPNAKETLSLLGTGPKIEDDVPLLTEKYDCTTYVETVAALAKSKSAGEFFSRLISIRYKDSKTVFTSRNHFPEADWIPNNEKSGNLKDVTGTVALDAGVAYNVEAKQVNRGKWLSQQIDKGKVSRSLASLSASEWAKPVDAKISYISLSDYHKALDKIPDGSILNIVRKNNTRQPVLITHQGFIIRSGGEVLLRHASPSGKIRTTTLKGYLDHIRDTQASVSWPVVGINLNQLID